MQSFLRADGVCRAFGDLSSRGDIVGRAAGILSGQRVA